MSSTQIAVISDVHGNLDALEAVLADIDERGVERILCLGDNIGYGPEPEGVIERIRSRGIPSVIGNHELAAALPEYLSWFNPEARKSLLKTMGMMSEEAIDYCARLPRCRVEYDARFVHGFPPDSPVIYMFQASETQLRLHFRDSEERRCFVGHTHDLEMLSFDGSRIQLDRLPKGRLQLDPEFKYIINIGSVGQPRDGDNRAKYALWDTEADTLEIRFVPYDIAAVTGKILAAGLPPSHANRLW